MVRAHFHQAPIVHKHFTSLRGESASSLNADKFTYVETDNALTGITMESLRPSLDPNKNESIVGKADANRQALWTVVETKLNELQASRQNTLTRMHKSTVNQGLEIHCLPAGEPSLVSLTGAIETTDLTMDLTSLCTRTMWDKRTYEKSLVSKS